MWKPCPELRLIREVKEGREIQVLEQKWIKEGFKDGEKYVIQTEWRRIPEVDSGLV